MVGAGRRVKPALLAIAVVGIGGLASASTAANVVAGSNAGRTSVAVTGAKMRSISYTTTTGAITGFTVNFRGPATKTTTVAGLPVTTTLFTTVRAHFGSNPDVLCVLGLYSAASDQTPATCTGFSQAANRSWALQITVS